MRGLSIYEPTSTSSSQSSVSSPPTSSIPLLRIAVPPVRLLRFLARYVGGGPISESRLVRWEYGNVTFLSRRRDDEKEDEQLRREKRAEKTNGARQRKQRTGPDNGKNKLSLYANSLVTAFVPRAEINRPRINRPRRVAGFCKPNPATLRELNFQCNDRSTPKRTGPSNGKTKRRCMLTV